MRNFFLLLLDEFTAGLKRIEVIIPSILNSIIPIFILTYGFSKLGYADYSKIISTGFLLSQLLAVAIPTVVFLTADMTFGNIYYQLSLPFSTRTILMVKFLTSYITSIILAVMAFTYPNLTIYKIFDYRLFLVLLVLLLQIIIITGFTLLLSMFVKDITRIGLVLSISSTLLVYLSPVFFPISVYPTVVHPIIYINPLTIPVLFMRELIEGNINTVYLMIIIGEALFYSIFSYYSLKKRITRLR